MYTTMKVYVTESTQDKEYRGRKKVYSKKNNMKPKKNSTEEEQGRVAFAEEYSYCSILTVL